MVGELRDVKQNGELIQVTTSSNSALPDNSSSVAGVVLYDEGIILLTGSWALSADELTLGASAVDSNPKWIYFGAGAQDGVTTTALSDDTFSSASFNLSFRGTTETQVVTMFAHAKRGEINYSNNPTFIKYGQDLLKLTSSHLSLIHI